MDDQPLFNLPIEPLSVLTRHLREVVVERAAGEPIRLDAQLARLKFTQEQPSVERMSDDWGAICEVFKQSAFYYISVSGVSLAAGDRIVLVYEDGREPVTLRVLELENGRARIHDPGEKLK